MASDAQMSLMMRIRADGQQAVRELRRVRGEVRAFATTGLGGTVGRGVMGAGSFGLGALRKTAGAAMNVLRRVAKWGGLAGMAVGGLGAMAVRTASGFQEMRMRLQAVLGSAQRAARVWGESESFFGKSKFFLQDIIEARILLESIGVAGAGAIESVGNAAAVLGRKLGDVAQIVASMETQPLRRLGIELRRAGQQGTFVFMDKMQRMRKVTAEGTQEMRQALLGIFDLKFGGAIDKTLRIFSGMWETLLGNMQRALARMGEGLLPVLQPLLERANQSLTAAFDTGRFTELGARAGAWLEGAIDKGVAFALTLKDAAQELSAVLQESPGAFGDVVMTALGEAAGLLGTVIVESIKATAAFWRGVAQLIGAAFGRYIYQLPGMGGARDRAAVRAIEEARGPALVDIGERLGVRMIGGESEQDYRARLANITAAGLMRPSMVSERDRMWLATEAGAVAAMQRGIATISDASENLREAVEDRAQEARDQVNEQLRESTGGFDFRDEYRRRLAEREAAREMVTHILARPWYALDNTGHATRAGYDVRGVEAPRGAYEHGQRTEGGYRVVVNVARLNMSRDGINEVVRKAARRAGGSGYAPAY